MILPVQGNGVFLEAIFFLTNFRGIKSTSKKSFPIYESLEKTPKKDFLRRISNSQHANRITPIQRHDIFS